MCLYYYGGVGVAHVLEEGCSVGCTTVVGRRHKAFDCSCFRTRLYSGWRVEQTPGCSDSWFTTYFLVLLHECFVQTSRYARSFSRCLRAPVVTVGDITPRRQPQTPDWRQDLASILLTNIWRSLCFQHCSTLWRKAAAQVLCC